MRGDGRCVDCGGRCTPEGGVRRCISCELKSRNWDDEAPWCYCADGGQPQSFWGGTQCARCGSVFREDLRTDLAEP